MAWVLYDTTPKAPHSYQIKYISFIAISGAANINAWGIHGQIWPN